MTTAEQRRLIQGTISTLERNAAWWEQREMVGPAAGARRILEQQRAKLAGLK